ncbi:SDR family oxidoreductase [Pseudonocardia sp. KRD-184]|uniref:SDR family oxidoreductase n=1 Tax=Pseudonocardia oceani TaxID=2792013 RepID=A0ABS6U2I8_9PSEU|nr:SDR family NAD(P)-dependent oxidoreductase [Pseudonocardia oceani]MBW0092531.1 SDR family oxidoreductase [Pseudonocardia oceani]MBW0095129.1 SDR family oxidoreductase [Pseudonocardia oceani]MBW0107863.1 SDR family oxidoreductase [Pseudonocardia oceani]MBW0119671.1 SDR family oxidoreductase [Pseudonocardia oceani]MBW0126334.1 SDR family oxidoreductase [Pseudonocardia oceani]
MTGAAGQPADGDARRVAFVTGGAGGIGTAICRQLAAAGRAVAVADLSREAAEKVAADIDGIGVPLDVTDPDSVAAAVAETTERLGAPTIVINVAGWDELKPFLETDEDFTHKVLEINLNGPIRVLRATLPAMVEARYGRVVNIASDAGRVGSSMESVYSGAKSGVIGFTKTIAREFAKHGISANTVCPGPTDTPLLRQITAGERSGNIIAAMTKAVPMRRMGTPDDVAPAVVFLASDAAGYITGQTLSASGGLTMS